MVNGLHLYSAFITMSQVKGIPKKCMANRRLLASMIQSAVQFMPLIHPFTHTFTHQRQLAVMQGTNQLVRSNWGLGVLLRTLRHAQGGIEPATRLTSSAISPIIFINHIFTWNKYLIHRTIGLNTRWRNLCLQAQRSDVCYSFSAGLHQILGGILVHILFADPLQILKVPRLLLGNSKLQLQPQIFDGI